MSNTITFFPVGNGDMTLIKLSDQTTILIDIKIRNTADDPNNDEIYDVASELRKKLKKDNKGRPYVNAFLLIHPDEDHCSGLSKHFHLGSLDDYNSKPPEDEELKIVINEIWSSPMIFRRKSKNFTLCKDAKAFNTEAKRRVKIFQEQKHKFDQPGNRIRIIGEDENGKTEDLEEILTKVDDTFSKVDGNENKQITMRVLGPLPKQDEEETEAILGSEKNRSSTIIQFSITISESQDEYYLFLSCGDAGVDVWERLWDKHHKNKQVLEYNLLLSPHHCSWHSLSHDSWSKSKNPTVSSKAKKALSQARKDARIISSSEPIKDDDNDPPCIGAKREYISIVEEDNFYCTGEFPNEEQPQPLNIVLKKKQSKENSLLKLAAIATPETLSFPNKRITPNKPEGFA